MKVEEEQNLAPEVEPVTRNAGPNQLPTKHVSLAGLSILVLIALAILAYVIFSGINERAKASTALRHDTLQASVLTVEVTRPVRRAASEEVILPGSMQSFI